MEDAIIKAVANSIEAIKATQKLQPQLDLDEMIDASERLLTALKDPNTTVEQLAVIQNEIETIKKEKGWQ